MFGLDKEKRASVDIIDKLKAENEMKTKANNSLEERIVNLEKEAKSNTSQPNVIKTDCGDILMF